MKYQSELINKIVEEKGHTTSLLHYESECVETWIAEEKGAYPKLTDYKGEWLNYIVENPVGKFPYVTLSNVTDATVNNVVPYSYKSAILKGSTKYRDIDTGEVLDVFEDGRNLELVSVKMPVLTTSNYKNLANDIFIDYGYISDGTINIQKKWLVSDFISIEPNVSYTTRSKGVTNDGAFAIAFYDKDKNFIVKRTSKKETSPTNAKFVRINVRKNNGLDVTEDEKNGTILYLEKTTEVLPFEEHKSNILSTPEDLELRGIGDVKDTLDCLTGEVTERIGEIMLDGSDDEEWMVDEQLVNNYKFLINLTNAYYTQGKITTTVISDKFPSISNGGDEVGGKDVESICINGWAQGKLNLSISKTKLNNGTIDELKQWLSQNPITVQYQLATEFVKPVYLSVVNQYGNKLMRIRPIEGTMNIYTSSDTIQPILSGEIPVEAITQNLSSFIEE